MTSQEAGETTQKLGWKFPRTFWMANVIELFERAAFYGMFITLTLYLTREIKFTDVEAGLVAAGFSSIIYLLPTFMGAMADRIGFRQALAIAFSLLTLGYALLGAFQLKTTAVVALGLIMFGGAIVKPVISGTVAKCSDELHRVRAFSIFYMVVNIGAFCGKTAASPLREEFGLKYINFYAACMALCALVWVFVFYRNTEGKSEAKSAEEAMRGYAKVLMNFRFMALILIVAGFWVIQGQLYATMPKYILRMLGEGAKPEWLANINPLVVVLLVVPITHVIRKYKPENAMAIGLFIIPCSALCLGLSPQLEAWFGSSVLWLHPITLTVIVGIGVQGLAECFLSPKFLEYASMQAPKGEEGLYLGYQHLTTFFAWAFGFGISGFLLTAYCPDPTTLAPEVQQQRLDAIANGTPLPEAYAHAHYIWYVFTGIGVAAFFALLLFKFVTNAIDRSRAAAQA
ncbi:MAG: MFS transporter [Planctomycetes bacterium]|nr:MFS transporter [Planctomycetota bacterium]